MWDLPIEPGLCDLGDRGWRMHLVYNRTPRILGVVRPEKSVRGDFASRMSEHNQFITSSNTYSGYRNVVSKSSRTPRSGFARCSQP
ncbi:Uncharacterized protein HZ326_1705 [Fusarium oxysporum f. sp. albedinis]|nr:Uncharacterized protein HZ326_1705 [Fusarium oxysporum f. sp. albedinis]